VYAAYGLVAFALKTGRLPGLETPATGGFVSSPFINRNSFATYAGIGLIVMCGLMWRLYRHEVMAIDGPRRLRIASFIETTGQRGAMLLAGAFLLLVALLLTGSRGGIVAAGIGLFVLGALTLSRGTGRSVGRVKIMACGVVLVVAVYVGFGDFFVDSIMKKGFNDTNRTAVYLITLWSILDAPLLGYGYGTFADVFPMYRDRSISPVGVWEQAHNTYLEVFQGLGLVFGSLLVASVLLLVLSCAKGAITRQRNSTIPCIAASVAFLVGVQALVDFSLQIQAVSLTFAAVLGAGVAQSESSQPAQRTDHSKP
jgi:O-antigen ligase